MVLWKMSSSSRLAIAPAQYQSARWLGAGADTGVKGISGAGGNDPFLKMFQDPVRKKADQLGLPPQTVLRNYIRGDQALRQGGAARRALALSRKR
jgi:hypothetical protein